MQLTTILTNVATKTKIAKPAPLPALHLPNRTPHADLQPGYITEGGPCANHHHDATASPSP